MLKTEQNTRAMERRVRSAAVARELGSARDLQTDFEHGQWWLTNTRTGAQWSVVDAEGGSAVDGFDFEEVG